MVHHEAALARHFPLAEKKLGENLVVKTSPPSVVPDVGGDPFVEAKQESVIGKKRANDSKPKGGLHVFPHFPRIRHVKCAE